MTRKDSSPKIRPEHLRFASIKQLCRLFGVHRTTINRWDRGGIQMTLAALNVLEARGLPISVLKDGMSLRHEDRARASRKRRELNELLKKGGF
ncbi:MAG: hypothetical protein AAGA67_05520 [Cyanobacteria bacterium P01_F01_bin.153]